MTKPATIVAAVRPRHAIIQAIAGHGSAPTIDDLLTITGLARKTLSDNINAAINDTKGALLERIKCTVTSLPAYRLTVRGKTWWEANKPEEKPAPKVGETVTAWAERCAATKAPPADTGKEEFSLLNVIADIRAAIGDEEGRIMLTDLAGRITDRMLERSVNTQTVVDALVAVADYLPDSYNYRLIDGIRTMDMLIDAQQAYIHGQQLIIDKLFRVKKNIEDTLRPAVVSFDARNQNRGAEIMANDTVAIITNAQALNDKLQHLLDSSRHECEGLRAQLQADSAIVTLEQTAPSGYLLRAPKRKPRVITKLDTAMTAAVAAVNAGAPSAEVLAIYPIGRASRRAQWRAA